MRPTLSISQHDIRALPSQFQRDFLQVGLSCGRLDDLADFGGSGEGYFIQVHVSRQGCTSCGSVSGYYSNYTRWETDLWAKEREENVSPVLKTNSHRTKRFVLTCL